MLTAGEDKGERDRFIPLRSSRFPTADFLGVRTLPTDDPFSPNRSDAMRIAIYARVSTDDKGQDPENQLQELRAWALNSGHAIGGEYVDHESGRKGTEKRKQ